MAQYNYQPKDYFYDIESFNTHNHLFTCVFKEPFTNTIIISYYTTDRKRSQKDANVQAYKEQYFVEDCFNDHNFKAMVEQKVRTIFKDLNEEHKNETYQFIWEDLSKLGFCPTQEQIQQGFQPIYGMQTFLQRLGLPKNQERLNLPFNNPNYQANFDDEKEQNNQLNGYMFAFNSHNYDETMLAMILGEMLEGLKSSYFYTYLKEQQQFNYYYQTAIGSYLEQDLMTNNIAFNPVQFVFEHKNTFTQDTALSFVQAIASTDISVLLNEKDIREKFNDILFDDRYRNNMKQILRNTYLCSPYARPIYNHWKRTGRYIDITLMVENKHTALKRLLGVKGFRIQESENLSQKNTQMQQTSALELIDDIVYNISDVIGTQVLFEDKMYQTKFMVKRDLLKEYPYIVYDENHQIKPFGRATADSTSASLIASVIAKDGEALTDIPVIDFTYPSPHAISYLKSLDAYKDKEIIPSDILEDTLEWYVRHVCKYTGNLPKRGQARYNFIMKEYVFDYDIEVIDQIIRQNCNNKRYQAFLDFKDVYLYYDYLRGKNLNRSELYHERLLNTYLHPSNLKQTESSRWYKDNQLQYDLSHDAFKAYTLTEINKATENYNTNIFYYDNEGNRTSCFATFALGGIHGQEINEAYYRNEAKMNQALNELKKNLQQKYKSAKNALEDYEHWFDNELSIDPSYIIQTSKSNRVSWKRIDDVKDQTLFKKSKKADAERFNLNDKYKYVSVGTANHEDFTSYYPMLIVNLAIFRKFKDYDPTKPIDLNEKIVDEYLAIYIDRARLKKLSKDENQSKEVRADAARKQETKKLLLNSASGAGDAGYDTLIRKNNAIISMRIIGQLFAFRIGMAQALAGAKVPSTNTDGLYTTDIDVDLNNQILEEISKDMYIGIEPEIVDNFISKDSNNRLEIVYSQKEQDYIISDAKGGTLTSYKEPIITKNLDHPAIIDKALAYYLWKKPNAVNQDFDPTFGKQMFKDIYEEYAKKNKLNELLRMYQWMIASSPGTIRYTFIRKSNGLFTLEQPMQHYNRLFLTKVTNGQQPTTFGLVTKYKIDMKTKNMKSLVQILNKPQRSPEDIEQILKLYPYSDATAYGLLMDYDVDVTDFTTINLTKEQAATLTINDLKTYKAISTKIKSLEETQNGEIINDNIMIYDETQVNQLLSRLDYDAYLALLEDTFNNSWKNITVDENIQKLINYYQI